ncbi:Choline kinase alpha-like protein [Dinothrombium tinctorium]|uniref:Choline kinase alpha-like protein n=1 Tax=Dinothrombium tinctorium TaxID=1965070 RepID=A0A3S3NQG1_9ACAR|nr:Choline kinase alpha-like protein [Dinothrombium tinctorium]RWS07273.1 Choline kinase alpha-like protein [Dinothrombium tinctorium]
MNAIEAFKVQYEKLNCESAQAIIVEKLSQVGLAPKLYGVFNGGRIEEYIPSECATVDDLEQIELSLAVMRKLARFHSLDLPLEKLPKQMDFIVSMEQFSQELDEREMEEYSLEDQKCIKEIFKFENQKELTWVNKIISRISKFLVPSHGDLHPNNILLKHNYESIDDRVMLIDYDMCGYFYRGYDIAYFLRMRRTWNQN